MTTKDEKKTKLKPPPVPIPEPEDFDTWDEDAEYVREFGYSYDDFRNVEQMDMYSIANYTYLPC